MKTLTYDELQRKYDDLLEENRTLKAKLRDITNKSVKAIFHHNPDQANGTLFSQAENETFNLNLDAEFAYSTINDMLSVNKYSQSHEKIALFMSLFKGRTDVFAKKWKNKKGYSGYSPVCLNEWIPELCNKPREKCSRCKNQAYEALSDSVIEKHLKGEYVIGIYPMNPDETCHFLAIDFDKEGKEDVEKQGKVKTQDFASLYMNKWINLNKNIESNQHACPIGIMVQTDIIL